MKYLGVVAACLAAAFLAACQTTAHQQMPEFNRVSGSPRILLVPVDVELSEVTAGGLNEPKADWTEAARQNIGPVLRAEHDARGNLLIDYVEAEGDPNHAAYEQILKLHSVVGKSAIIHQYVPGLQLPAKGGKFDWSLGPSVEILRQKYDADYALFVYIRDSYASAGRAAVMVVAALFRVGLQGGVQTGFASLVDLRTGDIVWFNRLARPGGDLRTPEAAQETIKTLLVGPPK